MVPSLFTPGKRSPSPPRENFFFFFPLFLPCNPLFSPCPFLWVCNLPNPGVSSLFLLDLAAHAPFLDFPGRAPLVLFDFSTPKLDLLCVLPISRFFQSQDVSFRHPPLFEFKKSGKLVSPCFLSRKILRRFITPTFPCRPPPSKSDSLVIVFFFFHPDEKLPIFLMRHNKVCPRFPMVNSFLISPRLGAGAWTLGLFSIPLSLR